MKKTVLFGLLAVGIAAFMWAQAEKPTQYYIRKAKLLNKKYS